MKHTARHVSAATCLLLCTTVAGLGQTHAELRRELDAKTRELRQNISVLEKQQSRLGYSAAELQQRQQLSDLIQAKRNQLTALQSLRSHLTAAINAEQIRRQETRARQAEIRVLQREIRMLEARKNQLGYSGTELQQRSDLDELINRKRALLHTAESTPIRTADDPHAQRRLAEAEIRALTQEIQLLEKEKARLGFTATDLQRRTELADLIAAKRALLAAKKQRR